MTHPFEKAKLGAAPFVCTHVTENAFVMPEGGTKAGGCCDYCGTGIRWEFWIRGADKRVFKVGCDCVAKTGYGIEKFEDVRRQHVRERRAVGVKIRREARAAAWEVERAERQASRVAASEEWRAEHEDLVARIEGYTGDNSFLQSMAFTLRDWGHLTQKQLDAVLRCYAALDRQAVQRERSTHVGSVGKRISGKVRVVSCKFLGKAAFYPYPSKFVVGLEDEQGNALVWFTSCAQEAFTEHDSASFSIKEHGEYLGVKQTTIQRLSWK